MIEDILLLDRSLFLWLNSLHLPWLDSFMGLLSGQIIWLPFIGYFLWLASRTLAKKQIWLFFLFLVLCMIASDVTSSYILKNVFNRLRPCRVEDLKLLIYTFGQKCGGKYGFVSSHAANSCALLCFSFIALSMKGKQWMLWILPLMVSFSRIYLGVHYPGDILGGVLVGTSWGLLFGWVFKNTMGPSET